MYMHARIYIYIYVCIDSAGTLGPRAGAPARRPPGMPLLKKLGSELVLYRPGEAGNVYLYHMYIVRGALSAPRRLTCAYIYD